MFKTANLFGEKLHTLLLCARCVPVCRKSCAERKYIKNNIAILVFENLFYKNKTANKVRLHTEKVCAHTGCTHFFNYYKLLRLKVLQSVHTGTHPFFLERGFSFLKILKVALTAHTRMTRTRDTRMTHHAYT